MQPRGSPRRHRPAPGAAGLAATFIIRHSAPGQAWSQYAENLEGNLKALLERVKSGTYRAPPVRRVHIPKGDGSQTRPIGIPTFEDKVLQRAVAMLLEAILLGFTHYWGMSRSDVWV